MESTANRLRPPARWFAAGLVTLMLLSMLPFASGVAAAASITAATGGSAISADYTGTANYATLVGPSIVGSGAGDIGAGTLTLTIPAGFVFKAATGTAALTGGAGCGTLSIGGGATITTTTVTVTTTGASTGVCSLDMSGLQVQPTSGTLPAAGNIVASGLIAGAAGGLTEVAGAATKIVYTQQPGAGTAGTGGVAWAAGKQPIVQVQDQFSNTRAQDSTTVVSLALGGGTVGAALTCTSGNSRQVAGGIATFAGCKIDKSGTNYTLTASASPALTTPISTAFDVTVGPAAQLVFTQGAIASTTIGANLAPQPVVTIQDAGGNTITALNNPAGDLAATVTLTIKPATPTVGGPGVLACTSNAVNAVNGVASTFANCKINTNSGANYQLRASATVTAGTITGDSNAFNIVGGTSTQLAFSTQPGGGTAGTAWGGQPAVQVRDASGNVAVTDNTTVVTLAIGTNPGSGTLTCTGGLTKTVVSGQATFAGCTINKVGTGYTLVATSAPVYTSATSSAFNVTIGAATKLGFTSEPGASTSNTPFTVQPVVAIQDAGGNTVTTAPATTVTLAIGTNPSLGTLTCTGGLTRTTVSGVATFSGCYLNNAGVGYTLIASTTGYTSATSTAFTVSAPAAVISLSAYPTLINRGGTSTLTVQFASFGASRQVTFQKRTALDYDWVTVSTVTMDSTGRATIPVAPTSTTSYRVTYAGATDLSAATSPTALVGVRYSVTLQPRSVSGTRTLARGTSVTYRATVRPIYSGQRVSFQIYQKVAGHWTFRTSATVIVDASGVATFSWRWGRTGQWYMRARANSTPLNTTAFSNIEKVIIR